MRWVLTRGPEVTTAQAFEFEAGQVVRFCYAKYNVDQRYRIVDLTRAPDKLWTHATRPPLVDAVVIEGIGAGSRRYTIATAELLALDPEEVQAEDSDAE
jgi:hypothetical protein